MAEGRTHELVNETMWTFTERRADGVVNTDQPGQLRLGTVSVLHVDYEVVLLHQDLHIHLIDMSRNANSSRPAVQSNLLELNSGAQVPAYPHGLKAQ